MRIILITLDDVSFYTLGFTKFFPDFTPRINELAEQSYTFWNAHCNIPFCEPSRSALMTGLYPQNNGSMQFNPIFNGTPTLSSILHDNGYYTILYGKNFHYKNSYWDESINKSNNFNDILKRLKNFNKDLLFSVNLSYAHRQFTRRDFDLNFDNFPNFLPKTKVMEQEITDYLFTLRLADTVVGQIIDTFTEEDIIVLTSDHGMSFPYMKGDCYGTSTNVPFMIKNNAITPRHDNENIISHVDFLPTLAEWLGFECQTNGISYFQTLANHENRNVRYVYTQLNRMMGGPPCRIRSLITKNISYTISIDRYYPGWGVDGWGWHIACQEMGDSYFNRNTEILQSYESLYLNPVEDDVLRQEMRFELLSYMKKFKDPCYRQAKNLFAKLL